MFPPVTELRARTHEIVLTTLRAIVGRLDPASLTGPQAVRLLDWFTAVERVAAAGKALVAARAAETNGATADPASERDLLAAATRESVRELRGRAERVKAAALPDDRARHDAIRRSRSAREHVGDDGAWNLHLRGTKDDGARFMAHARPFIDAEFRRARKEGRREPAEAYAFDGLLRMADAGGRRDGGGTGRAPVKAILRADLPAIRRGALQRGEVCEIVGYGPLPVSVARELLGDAFLAVVLTSGHDVLNVTHLGRAPTAFQQTALEWSQPECEVLGCSATSRLERDHRVDWADTRHTRLDELERLCHHHHALKTRHGWQLEPGTGKRRLLAPDQLVAAEPP